MKKFDFPLERVMSVRKIQLEQEETRLQQLRAELAGVEREQLKLQQERNEAEQEVRAGCLIPSEDFRSLSSYQVHARNCELVLVQKQSACQKRVAEQQQRWMEAKRKQKLLEKLKERRLAEWTYEVNRELENSATDSFLARW